MEMEGAEKANTESVNSVTSEEQSSLADESLNDKTPGDLKDETEQGSASEKLAETTGSENQDSSGSEEVKTSPENSKPEEHKQEEVGQESESETPPENPKSESDDAGVADTPSTEETSTATDDKATEVEKSTEEPTGQEETEVEADELAASQVEEPEEASLKDGSAEAHETSEAVDKSKEVKPSAASSVPEADLSEQAEKNQSDDIYEEYQDVDFTTFSKEELVEVVKKLGKDDNPFRADKLLQVIAPLFNNIRDNEKKEALEKFKAEGGTLEEFQFRPDELSLRFDANYKLIKDKKSSKFREQETERAKNLVLAEDLLEELREFVDSDESSASFNQFKEIQQKWKDLGDVPSQQARTLWANYNALIHRFYDQRSIYFELKELDRKKNYEAKIKLCEKAEKLDKLDNIREAIRTLNDLHHEFKHLGPVPQELQEDLWQRFKVASDKVYERRKTFVHELKEELSENQEKKEQLVEKIKVYNDFDSDRIKEWNAKTKEVIALQKEWESIGGLPKDKAKVINREFWSAFKQFFRNKHLFFKKLDAERDTNLVKKQELLAKAIELKDSEEWDKTSNELKRIQSQWREIGPVPEKMRKKLYDEFKAACDYFFDRRREGMKSSQEEYKDNLKKKKEITTKIAELVDKADDNLDKFNALREQFEAVGYVPKKNIQSIKTEFQEAVERFLNAITVLNVKEKTEISLATEFSGLANSEHSETELYHKEQSVRRQISKYEDDIALWQNNLEFFAESKSTEKLRKEVNKKIDDARIQVEGLRRQLKMLRSL